MLTQHFRTSIAGCALLAVAASVCPSVVRAFGQDSKPAIQEPRREPQQEPQYESQIEVVKPDGGLAPLEQQKLLAQGKHVGLLGVSQYSAAYTVPNSGSPLRVESSPHFVVKVPASAANLDPATLMFLKPFEVGKDKRMLSMGKNTSFLGVANKEHDAKQDSIPLTFKRYGTGSLEITPAQPLAPGEYVIEVPNLGMMGFCFGVDAK